MPAPTPAPAPAPATATATAPDGADRSAEAPEDLDSAWLETDDELSGGAVGEDAGGRPADVEGTEDSFADEDSGLIDDEAGEEAEGEISDAGAVAVDGAADFSGDDAGQSPVADETESADDEGAVGDDQAEPEPDSAA